MPVLTFHHAHMHQTTCLNADDQRQPFLDRMRAIDRAQALVKPRAHLVIRVAKIHRVVCIGGHAFMPNSSVERSETVSVSFHSSTTAHGFPPNFSRSARTRSVNSAIA